MRPLTKQFFTGIVITTFSLVGFACVLHLFTSIPGFEKDLPVWLGAIGTLGAFGGTIYLAHSETRRRNRGELTRARIRAVGMMAQVIYASSVVRELGSKLQGAVRVDKSPEELIGYGNNLVELDLWTLDDVEHLIPLPNNTAIMLAHSVSEIRRIISTFQRLKHGDTLKDPLHRKAFADFHYDLLKEIADNLGKCIHECVRAREHLYRPSLDQL